MQQPTSLRGTKQPQNQITKTNAITKNQRHCEERSNLKTKSQKTTSLRGTKQPQNHYQKVASFLAMTTRDGNNKKTTSLRQLTSLRGTKQPQNHYKKVASFLAMTTRDGNNKKQRHHKTNLIATTHVIARHEATSKPHHKHQRHCEARSNLSTTTKRSLRSSR